MLRDLHQMQQSLLEQLILKLDKARELENGDEARALEVEIEWREQLMEACRPFVRVKQCQAKLVAGGECV